MKRIPVIALLTTATMSLLISGATVRIAAANMKTSQEAPQVIVLTTYLTDAMRPDDFPPLVRAKAEAIVPLNRRSTQQAIRAGVKIAFGTDAGVIPHGQNAKEFGALVARGMSPIDAIRAATVNAAELLGVADRGNISPGLFADLVAVPGNPLDDILSPTSLLIYSGALAFSSA